MAKETKSFFLDQLEFRKNSIVLMLTFPFILVNDMDRVPGGLIKNDIALLRLASRVNLDEEDANVICLPSKKEKYDKGSCMGIGWGRTR